MPTPLCTVENFEEDLLCFGCLSQTELDAMQVVLLCQLINEATCTPEALQTDAAPFTTFSEQQMKEAFTSLLCRYAVATDNRADCDVTTLRNEAKCISCLPGHTVKAILSLLMCRWLRQLST